MSLSISKQPPFSNLQLELLKLFNRQLSDKDLLEVKLLLAHHFLHKAMDAADETWEKNKWTKEDAIKLSKEHHRTTYKSDNP